MVDATPKTSGGKKKSDKKSKKRNKSGAARRDAGNIVPSLTNEIEDSSPDREPSKEILLKQRRKKRKNVECISHIDESDNKNDATEECNDSIPEEQFSVSGRISKGDAARNTKKGKSKNLERKKKKRQLVSNHTPSDNLLETREENAEDEVYQMSSGDEDYSKGMKNGQGFV